MWSQTRPGSQKWGLTTTHRGSPEVPFVPGKGHQRWHRAVVLEQRLPCRGFCCWYLWRVHPATFPLKIWSFHLTSLSRGLQLGHGSCQRGKVLSANPARGKHNVCSQLSTSESWWFCLILGCHTSWREKPGVASEAGVNYSACVSAEMLSSALKYLFGPDIWRFQRLWFQPHYFLFCCRLWKVLWGASDERDETPTPKIMVGCRYWHHKSNPWDSVLEKHHFQISPVNLLSFQSYLVSLVPPPWQGTCFQSRKLSYYQSMTTSYEYFQRWSWEAALSLASVGEMQVTVQCLVFVPPGSKAFE